MKSYYGIINRRILNNHEDIELFGSQPESPSINFYTQSNDVDIAILPFEEQQKGFKAKVRFKGNKERDIRAVVYSVSQKGRIDTFHLLYLRNLENEINPIEDISNQWGQNQWNQNQWGQE